MSNVHVDISINVSEVTVLVHEMSFLERENNTKIPELKEVYKNLLGSLGEDAFKQYTALLKLYFSAKISKLKFDEDARTLLCSPEQVHLHNMFLLSLSFKINTNKQPGVNKRSESIEYMPPLSPVDNFDGSNIKYCSQEMCLPSEELVKGRICVTAIDHCLDGAEEAVTNIIVVAAQTFLKNIITAMLSRTAGYKIRENNFQHAIGVPVASPWLRNTTNIIDVTQETNVTVNDDEQTFEPVLRNTLETAQQQTAFSLACSGRQQASVTSKYTLKNLYETLLHNPHIINNHTIHSVNLERILSMLDCS